MEDIGAHSSSCIKLWPWATEIHMLQQPISNHIAIISLDGRSVGLEQTFVSLYWSGSDNSEKNKEGKRGEKDQVQEKKGKQTQNHQKNIQIGNMFPIGTLDINKSQSASKYKLRYIWYISNI